jgi:hypothetical protein
MAIVFQSLTTTLTHIALEGSKVSMVESRFTTKNNIKKHILKNAIKNLDEEDHDGHRLCVQKTLLYSS